VNVEEAAERMVRHQLGGIRDQRVLAAMRAVPRHAFVPHVSIEQAYSDRALPTLNDQTISQPYIVARMSELLAVEPGNRVLEVGTGSGYQAAVLAAMGAHVIGIERDAELAEQAQQTIAGLDLGEAVGSVQVVTADGTLGYPALAPYDRILIAAAAPKLPEPLAEQLADPGRAVLPIGDRLQQVLTILDKREGQWSQSEDTPCRFVPLIGAYGFDGAAEGPAT
jgi:protein-L-isoaspartate(D-aspartate) O-methyltransferase